MREVVPVVVPWLVMFCALSASYTLEDRMMRARATPGDAGGPPLGRPSVALSVLATVLLGPLMAPIYFWRSRKAPIGLALGLSMTVLSMGLFAGAAHASRAWLASNTLTRAHAACTTTGPLAADPEGVKAEGPCAAVVEAYDVRSATKEQVKSLGAKFVDVGVSAEGSGGYARELTAEEKAKQQEVLDARIAAADAVVTTASVPGRPAPKIVSRAAVEATIRIEMH